MKASVVLAGLLGLVLAVGLIVYFGAGSILASVERIGWAGFGLFVLWQMATFLPLGAAWRLLALGRPPPRLWSFVWGRQVREAAADVLPFSPIGGLVIGTRAAVLCGVTPAWAYASVAVDLVTEIIAQFLFMALGLVLVLGRLAHGGGAHDPLIAAVFVGLALMVAGASTFIVTQRRGLGLVDGLVRRFLPAVAASVEGANQLILDIYRRPARLALSTALHGVAWFAAAFGSWIALHFMGVRIPILSVIAIESLVSAVKSAGFMVPNAAGVQEGGFAVMGALFGLTPEVAIALSLLRRARDIFIGAPTLIVWQAVEGRRLFRAAAPAPSALEQRT